MSTQTHSTTFLKSCFLAASLLPLLGCTQVKELKQLFGKRPTQDMPTFQPVEVTFINQSWSQGQREWFYHTGQGSMIVPYKWFFALEQPKPTLTASPLFSDRAYLSRFGFLAGSVSKDNPDGLPDGLVLDAVVDPGTGEQTEQLGLTCSACHTGQLEHNGKGVRIDGGTPVLELEAFQTELGYAVAFTDKIPFRFNRFAKRVLGDDASSEAKNQLRAQLRDYISVGLKEAEAAESGNLYSTAGGFGRIDALGRISNLVFATELNNDKNLHLADAPVKYPPLWDTSWFSMVQYNASIQQPIMRNIGEALGLRARVNLKDQARLYQSSVNVPNVWHIEEQLAGQTPFTGLSSPKWPVKVFGPLDQAKVQQGAMLYTQLCQKCHLPPMGSPELQQAHYWQQELQGRRSLKLNLIPLDVIGTDPKEAANWADSKIDLSAVGLGVTSGANGLRVVTQKVRDLKFDGLGLSPEARVAWSGYRDDQTAAPLAYAARPLDGMWATPPFLHNGSVPNLYELLLPADRRSKTFYTGTREFDIQRVGYVTSSFQGAFGLNTTTVGNSNAGHEFSNRSGKGVIGPELTDTQRYALIEYLKSI